MKIKTATAEYTGGNIYIYYGELENGLWFRTSDLWESIAICTNDTSGEDADYCEFFEEYMVEELEGIQYKELWNEMLYWIINNNPKGNYLKYEMEERLIND